MLERSNDIVLLAGLPRTGSTLLQNILAQNPKFHSEGNSALCQVMGDVKGSCENNAIQQLTGVNKDVSFKRDLLRKIPDIYYPEIEDKVILDKTRTWIQEENLLMAREHIKQDIKSIIMVRPVDEIIASFARVSIENNKHFDYVSFLSDENDLMREMTVTYYAAKSKDPSFIFVSYDELVLNPNKTLSQIYKHIGLIPFHHNLQKVTQTVFEDDERNDMVGMHKIRSKIAKQKNKIVLPDWVKHQSDEITRTIFNEINTFKLKEVA